MQDAYETPFDRYDTPVDRDEATPCHEARLDRLEAVVDCMNARLNRLERRMRRGMLVLLVGSTA
jgi:hypothetical protein